MIPILIIVPYNPLIKVKHLASFLLFTQPYIFNEDIQVNYFPQGCNSFDPPRDLEPGGQLPQSMARVYGLGESIEILERGCGCREAIFIIVVIIVISDLFCHLQKN